MFAKLYVQDSNAAQVLAQLGSLVKEEVPTCICICMHACMICYVLSINMQVEEEEKEGPPAPVEEQTAPTEKDKEESSQTEEEEEEAPPRFHACMCLIKFCRHSSMLALFICMFDIHACLLHA